MAAVAKPSNTMHIILLALLGATLAGVLFLVYVAMGDDGRYERMVGMLSDQKTMISRVENNMAAEPEETAVTQPTTPTFNEHVLYENKAYGFRIVTSQHCADVLQSQVISSPSYTPPGTVIGVGVVSKSDPSVNANSYFLMPRASAEALMADEENRDPRALILTQLPENRAIVQYQHQDPPPFGPLSDPAGQYCHHIIQMTLPQK